MLNSNLRQLNPDISIKF